MAARRIGKEHRDVCALHADWLSVEFASDKDGETDVFHWICWIAPTGGMYEGLRFEVHVKLPSDYPFKPPRSTFVSTMPHPAWRQGEGLGGCCGNGEWSPAQTVVSWLLRPALLLFDCPISKQLMMDPATFGMSTREAKRTFIVEEWVRRVREFEPKDARMLRARTPLQQQSWISHTRPALMSALTVHDALLPDLASIIVGYLDDGANRYARPEAELCADTHAYVQHMTAHMRRKAEREAQERRAVEESNEKAATAAREAAAARAALSPATPLVHVTVRSLTGKQFPLQLRPDSIVYDLKLLIHRAEGIPVDQQRLICSGGLIDDQTIQALVERQTRAGALGAGANVGPSVGDVGSLDKPLLVHLVLRLKCSCWNMQEMQPFVATRKQASTAQAASAAGSAAAPAPSTSASSSGGASAAGVSVSSLEFVPCGWSNFTGVWCGDRASPACDGTGSAN